MEDHGVRRSPESEAIQNPGPGLQFGLPKLAILLVPGGSEESVIMISSHNYDNPFSLDCEPSPSTRLLPQTLSLGPQPALAQMIYQWDVSCLHHAEKLFQSGWEIGLDKMAFIIAMENQSASCPVQFANDSVMFNVCVCHSKNKINQRTMKQTLLVWFCTPSRFRSLLQKKRKNSLKIQIFRYCWEIDRRYLGANNRHVQA